MQVVLQVLHTCTKLGLLLLFSNSFFKQTAHHYLYGEKKELLLKLFVKYLVSCLYVTSGPAKREFSSKEKKVGEDEGRQSSEEQNYQHSPLRKPLIRSSASSVMPGKRYVCSSGNPSGRKLGAWGKIMISVCQIPMFLSGSALPSSLLVYLNYKLTDPTLCQKDTSNCLLSLSLWSARFFWMFCLWQHE